MQKASDLLSGWRRNVVLFLTAVLIVTADQLSKIGIRSNLAVGESAPESGFFQLTRIDNTGAAFGLFQDHSFALTIIAVVGIAILLLYALFAYHRFPFLDSTLNRVAIGLMLGGTVGNLIDRLYLGCVTDFIDIGIWPAFNIADSAVTVGAIMFAYTLLRLVQTKKQYDGQNI
jgi:signal peptidase II